MSAEREHWIYADNDGNPELPEECIEECPGCHFPGNTEYFAFGDCDLCDEDA